MHNVQLKQPSKHLKFINYHFLFNHVNLHQGACHEHFTAKFSINKDWHILKFWNSIFADWHILRKNWYKAFMPVFRHIFWDTTTAWDFELLGVRCCTFGGESVNLVWLNCHGVSWWLVIDHQCSGTRTVIGDYERHLFYLIWYLYCDVFDCNILLLFFWKQYLLIINHAGISN